jgi:hypothetical protein
MATLPGCDGSGLTACGSGLASVTQAGSNPAQAALEMSVRRCLSMPGNRSRKGSGGIFTIARHGPRRASDARHQGKHLGAAYCVFCMTSTTRSQVSGSAIWGLRRVNCPAPAARSATA